MNTQQREKLEQVLGALQSEPGLDALEERVHESGHLEDADYSAVLERKVEGEALDNLRRHVLFCDVCSAELLRRLAPQTEVALVAEEKRARSRRIRRRLLLLLPVLALAAAGWWLSQGSAPEEPPPETVETSSPPPAVLQKTWAGLGRNTYDARPEDAGRIFLRLNAADASLGSAMLVIFHVAGALATPLYPESTQGQPLPMDGTLLPPGGLRDPGGPDPAWLLVIASAGVLPDLATPGDRASFSRSLQRHLLAGHPVSDLPGLLQGKSLGVQRQVLLLRIKR